MSVSQCGLGMQDHWTYVLLVLLFSFQMISMRPVISE